MVVYTHENVLRFDKRGGYTHLKWVELHTRDLVINENKCVLGWNLQKAAKQGTFSYWRSVLFRGMSTTLRVALQ